MTDTLAPSASPPHHLKVWSDGQRIFCEIPGIHGKPPYITTYPYDSRGIDLTLSLLGCIKAKYDYQGTEAIPSGYTGRRAVEPIVNPASNALAEALLRKMGITKP